MSVLFQKYSSSLHLRNALQLRQEGRYPEALAELDLACKEEDGLAWFVRGEAFYGGGWGLLKDKEKAQNCYKRSGDLGCEYGMVAHDLVTDDPVYVFELHDPFAIFLNNSDMPDQLEKACREGNIFAYPYHPAWIEKAAEIGDAEGLYCMGERTDEIKYYQKGAEQGHGNCMNVIRNAYLYGNYSVKINHYKAAKLTIKLGDFDVFNSRFYREKISTCELFNYGRYFIRTGRRIFNESEVTCKQVYNKVTKKARSAVLCFLWMRLLSKDTRGIIAKMVWRSRKTETELWV